MNWGKLFKWVRIRRSEADFHTCVSSTHLQVWLDIHKGNLSAIVKQGNQYTEQDWREAWYILNDSYIAIFRFDKKIKRLLNLRKEYALSMDKILGTGNRQHEMDAKILEVDIEKESDEATEESSENQSFTDLIAVVEKYYVFPIEPQKITVEKFYTYLKLLREERNRLETLKAFKNA